jgi:hypothetical protein
VLQSFDVVVLLVPACHAQGEGAGEGSSTAAFQNMELLVRHLDWMLLFAAAAAAAAAVALASLLALFLVAWVAHAAS